MPAGSLRERVTFQRQGSGAGDGMGNPLTAFADLANAIGVAAQIKPLRQGETVIAEGVQGRVLCEVIVRSTSVLAGITVGDRMIDTRTSRTFNVKSPPTNPDMRGRYLKILVETGGASG